jgi:peptidoglycan-N-acetylglucosamine deacetylase
MEPVITVVIPAYNEEKYLPRCLEALKSQDFQKPVEILVVDNCSTDATVQIAKSYGARVIREKRKGQLFAKQTGALSATAEIVVILDADNAPSESWLSCIYSAFEDNKNSNVVAMTKCYTYPEDTPIWYMVPSEFIPSLLAYFPKNVGSIPVIWGGNVAFLKSSFIECGGYDITSVSPAETELGLGAKLRKQGRIIWNPGMDVRTCGRRMAKGPVHNILEFGLRDYWGGYVLHKLTKKNLKKQMKDIR